MEITAQSRLLLRVQTVVFVVLLLGAVAMLAWLSVHYDKQWDWTASGRNTLSEPSRALLDRMPGAIEVTAYAREQPLLRQSVQQLLKRYQRHSPHMSLRFVNPDLVPDQVREQRITVDGELVITYQQRREHAKSLTERALSNALEKLARSDVHWVAYLTGHGERDLLGGANHDLGRLGKQLERRGFNLQGLTLADTGEVADNVGVLVLSQARVPLLPGEVSAIERYVDRGGNLLWLADPGSQGSLEGLAGALGLRFEPGTVVDPGTRLHGIEHPAFVPITAYPSHALTRGFRLVTVYPYAAGIAWQELHGWEISGILGTGLRAWSETGDPSGEIRFDEGADVPGPLDIGVAMSRSLDAAPDSGADGETRSPRDSDKREQRIVVIGDGDFLSNAYLGSGGNLDLALHILNWLAAEDALVDIPIRQAPDLHFELSRTMAVLIGFLALLGLPGLFLGIGAFIWHRRRRR
jgi:ABC-type uncharacterized transport system involved in gliding motility auxiliary subunit